MANDLTLGLVIGGAVASSVGKAFNDVEGRVKRLDAQAAKSKVLQKTIGETKTLQEEWRRAHLTGSATADGLRKKLEANLDGLRRQGVEVRNLGKAYEEAGRRARAAEFRSKGQQQIQEGGKGLKSVGKGLAVGAAAMAVPTMVAANYQAQIRQMALWAHTAGTGDEAELAKQISAVAQAKGMSQQALAEAVGGLIEKGIEWKESAGYADLIADLVDGQGMEKETIATLFSAFKEAGVKKEDMAAMLGQVAAAGDIGAFGPKDMARYMPPLLGTIRQLGMQGPDAVRFLGASLQSQFKQTQDSAAAATNMNNLLNAVISGTSQERFAKQGYDLAASITSLTKSGKAENPVDAFIMLTTALVKKQDPAKAKKVEAMKAKIKASKDGSAEQEQAMVELIEAAGLATIVSDQSASAGLMAQIKYGGAIKDDMASIKDTDGKAKIDKDAEMAREASKSRWASVTAGIEGSLESVGSAIRPLTDAVADGLVKVLSSLKNITDESPKLVTGAVAIGGAIAAVRAGFHAFKIAKGVMNIGRGTLMGNPNIVQKVEVVNGMGGGGGGLDGAERDRGRKRGRPVRTARRRPGLPSRAPSVAGAPGTPKPRMQVYSNGAPVPAKPAPLSGWKPPTAVPKPSMVPAGGAPRLSAGLRGSPLLAVVDSALDAKDTYDHAETRDEKAEGYGSAAGGLAGSLAGAAVGAAIGSVVPVIGTVIGGLLGGFLGSLGGKAAGGALGKAAFGGPDAEQPAPPVAVVDPGVAAAATPGVSPAVSFDPNVAGSADPFVVKNPYGRKPRFPGVSMKDDPERLQRLEDMRKALAPAPMYAPRAVTRNGPSSAVPSMSAVADSFKAPDVKAPIPALMAPIKTGAVPGVPSTAPKVEQRNTYSPTFQITVQGEGKDPQKLAAEMEPQIRRMMADMAQQAARSSNYDAPG